jgi:hypothetical protein
VTAPADSLGLCVDGYCDREAAVYAFTGTDRVTLVRGQRAAQLARMPGGDGQALCLDCAVARVEETVHAATRTARRAS